MPVRKPASLRLRFARSPAIRLGLICLPPVRAADHTNEVLAATLLENLRLPIAPQREMVWGCASLGIFHALLAQESTLRAKSRLASAVLWNIRAKVKTLVAFGAAGGG